MPIKITETLNQSSGRVESRGRDDRKVNDSKESSFQGKLKHLEDQNVDERIHALVNQIFDQGEKLGKKADLGELKVYKGLIAEFLNEAASGTHQFSKESFLDRRGRYRVYATVKKINTKLNELTSEVIKKEQDHIAILHKIDDIRGLVMDMFL